MNLIRFHGVFAPNSKYRKAVTGYDKSKLVADSTKQIDQPSQRYRMSWAMRLKRVFNIDITICRQCQGRSLVNNTISTTHHVHFFRLFIFFEHAIIMNKA